MSNEGDPAAFTRYKRYTHEEIHIDYAAMNLVDDFTELGVQSSLWLVYDWIIQEARRAVGSNAGLARMLAARLSHELELQAVERHSG